MKIILILFVLIGIYFIFQSFIAAKAPKTEKQKYRLVLKDKELEIRYYPSATFATVYSAATNYKELGSNGFRKLVQKTNKAILLPMNATKSTTSST